MKRLTAAFFVNFIWLPLKVILRFIFYKIIVKTYRLYLYALRKLGWSGIDKNKPFSWLVSQKLVHFIVILLTALIVFFNFTINKTQAVFMEDLAGKTFLSELISDEFSESDELIEEYFDQEAVISSVQQTYLDNLSSIKSQDFADMSPDEMDYSDDTTNLSSDNSAIIRPEIAATSKIKRPRDGVISYTVLPGDTVSTIADEFGISVNTILWENNLTAYSLIRPGDALSILPVTGIAHGVAKGDTLGVIAKKYGIEENEIIEFNKLDNSGKLSIGQKLIIPGGRKIVQSRYASNNSSQSYTGISAIKDLIAPSSSKPVGGNKMNWPTQGYRITQYYSWRHTGLDIANKIGTPIYAADTGVIEYVGWGRGYGNQIVIDHGGGKKTRYAHLSKSYVKKGAQVSKGQAIAAMGSTGWSTGSHLHFEIIINGAKYNPLNYIK